jgi:hypothetical protein
VQGNVTCDCLYIVVDVCDGWANSGRVQNVESLLKSSRDSFKDKDVILLTICSTFQTYGLCAPVSLYIFMF